MSFISKLLIVFSLVCTPLFSTEQFTVCSYNCGALSDHYDYIRAVSLHKVVQQRYDEEPELMDLVQKVEALALKICFTEEPEDLEEWTNSEYEGLIPLIAAEKPNQKWRELSEAIVIHDEEVHTLLLEHVKDLTRSEETTLSNASIDATRRVMAKRIFANELKYDIIALQEADYLDASLFPENYSVRFAGSNHSVNGIAWNHERFELVEEIGNVLGRSYVLLLRQIDTGKTVAVGTGHLRGCNPFLRVGDDSAQGDGDLLVLIEVLDSVRADMKLIAMDSNVTASHPRMNLLKDAGYMVDYEKYLEPTCTNPYQILNTRIDWIAVKSGSISNIPVMGVGLNCPRTNLSDHKPIAARACFAEMKPHMPWTPPPGGVDAFEGRFVGPHLST